MFFIFIDLISKHLRINSTTEKCLNGGYTSTVTTKCICPPGFNGELCETGKWTIFKYDKLN